MQISSQSDFNDCFRNNLSGQKHPNRTEILNNIQFCMRYRIS